MTMTAIISAVLVIVMVFRVILRRRDDFTIGAGTDCSVARGVVDVEGLAGTVRLFCLVGLLNSIQSFPHSNNRASYCLCSV